MSKFKKTFRRYVVVKGCKHNFGFGPGVVARDEITYTDAAKRGFDNVMFEMSKREDAMEMILGSVTCLIEEKKGGWSKDPQVENRKTKAKLPKNS